MVCPWKTRSKSNTKDCGQQNPVKTESVRRVQVGKGRKMAAKFDNLQLALLKQFVDLCKDKPQLLHAPQLKFFKDWLVR